MCGKMLCDKGRSAVPTHMYVSTCMYIHTYVYTWMKVDICWDGATWHLAAMALTRYTFAANR